MSTQVPENGVSPPDPPAVIPPELLAFAEALGTAIADRLGDRLADALVELDRNRVPSELRAFTPEELAGAWKVRTSWVEQRAYNRQMPSTKLGKHVRVSYADALELLKSGAVGPRGKQLPRAS